MLQYLVNYKWVWLQCCSMAQSKAVRDRKHRQDNSQEANYYLLGCMVTARAYNGNVRMVDCSAPVPTTAAFAGRMADGLLPTE